MKLCITDKNLQQGKIHAHGSPAVPDWLRTPEQVTSRQGELDRTRVGNQPGQSIKLPRLLLSATWNAAGVWKTDSSLHLSCFTSAFLQFPSSWRSPDLCSSLPHLFGIFPSTRPPFKNPLHPVQMLRFGLFRLDEALWCKPCAAQCLLFILLTP